MTLIDLLPATPEPDAVFDAFAGWSKRRGLALYPHQEEALIEIVSGANVILSTPTGSGKSLVAMGAHFTALADGRRTFYTAPIKALVSEKFFDLCAAFGPAEVGMMTGDASVNAEAPIICCTAEVLANIALRDGAAADVGQVVADGEALGRLRDRHGGAPAPRRVHVAAALRAEVTGDVLAVAQVVHGRDRREEVLPHRVAQVGRDLDELLGLHGERRHVEALLMRGHGSGHGLLHRRSELRRGHAFDFSSSYAGGMPARIFFWIRRKPSSTASGRGGQPGTCTSTGTILSTPWRIA